MFLTVFYVKMKIFKINYTLLSSILLFAYISCTLADNFEDKESLSNEEEAKNEAVLKNKSTFIKLHIPKALFCRIKKRTLQRALKVRKSSTSKMLASFMHLWQVSV